jgi:hypothetical protein
LGAVIGTVGGAAACVMLEAISARRRQTYHSRHDRSDERFQDREATDYGDWQDPAADGRFRGRWAPEPNGSAPAHQIADYRLRR